MAKRIRSGELRHQINVQSISSTTTDTYGQLNYQAWTTDYTVRAHIRTLQGAELELARQLYPQASRSVTIDYIPGLNADGATENRIVFGSRVMHIGGIRIPDEEQWTMELLCSEESESTSGIDSDATTFVTAASITDAKEVSACHTLVEGLKSSGLWDRAVAIYPFMGSTAATHKLNLKNPVDTDAGYRLDFNGTWYHSSSGATPDGSTAYADTHINVAEKMPNYSFHGNYYSRTPHPPGTSDYYLWGVTGGTPLNLDFFNSSSIFSQCCDATPAITATGQSVWRGLFTVSCWGYDTNFYLYRDATQIGSQTGARQGYNPDINVLTPRSLYIGANNNAGTAANFSSWECAFASFGYALDSDTITAANSAIAKFQTALGRAVV